MYLVFAFIFCFHLSETLVRILLFIYIFFRFSFASSACCISICFLSLTWNICIHIVRFFVPVHSLWRFNILFLPSSCHLWFLLTFHIPCASFLFQCLLWLLALILWGVFLLYVSVMLYVGFKVSSFASFWHNSTLYFLQLSGLFILDLYFFV